MQLNPKKSNWLPGLQEARVRLFPKAPSGPPALSPQYLGFLFTPTLSDQPKHVDQSSDICFDWLPEALWAGDTGLEDTTFLNGPPHGRKH